MIEIVYNRTKKVNIQNRQTDTLIVSMDMSIE